MNKFYSIFFIFFSFQVFAIDISEFKIEGIGLGDNLLDYFNVAEIQKAKKNYPYKDDKYFEVELKIKSFENYPNIQVSLRISVASIALAVLLRQRFDLEFLNRGLRQARSIYRISNPPYPAMYRVSASVYHP